MPSSYDEYFIILEMETLAHLKAHKDLIGTFCPRWATLNTYPPSKKDLMFPKGLANFKQASFCLQAPNLPLTLARVKSRWPHRTGSLHFLYRKVFL